MNIVNKLYFWMLMLLSVWVTPAQAIMDGDGHDIFPITSIFYSTITVQGGSETLYSLQTASGIYVLAGAVNAPLFIGSGAGLTNISAAGIGAGLLGSGVIASSIAVDGVYTNAIANLAVTDAKINDVAGGKITGVGSIATNLIAAGSLGANVIASSVAVNSVYDGAITAVSGSKVSGDISGNAANITGNLAASQVAAGSLGAGVIASSIAVDGVYTNAIQDSAVTNAKLAGSIDPAKITGTAAILGANTFTGVQTYASGSSLAAAAGQAGVNVSTNIIVAGRAVYSNDGITSVADGATLDAERSTILVAGNPGPVTLSATSIASGISGQIVTLVGTDDAKKVKIPSGGNIKLTGDVSFKLGLNDVMVIGYYGTAWVEVQRIDN